MGKDPAFLFYPSKFLTGTMFMNNEQLGIYIKLLCVQHQHGGIINKIAFNSLVGDDELIRSKFIETEHGFLNETLAQEMERRNKKSNNMSETAKKVWDKRKLDKNTLLQKENTFVKELYYNSNEIVSNIDTFSIQPKDTNTIEYKNGTKENLNEVYFSEIQELFFDSDYENFPIEFKNKFSKQDFEKYVDFSKLFLPYKESIQKNAFIKIDFFVENILGKFLLKDIKKCVTKMTGIGIARNGNLSARFLDVMSMVIETPYSASGCKNEAVKSLKSHNEITSHFDETQSFKKK